MEETSNRKQRKIPVARDRALIVLIGPRWELPLAKDGWFSGEAVGAHHWNFLGPLNEEMDAWEVMVREAHNGVVIREDIGLFLCGPDEGDCGWMPVKAFRRGARGAWKGMPYLSPYRRRLYLQAMRLWRRWGKLKVIRKTKGGPYYP